MDMSVAVHAPPPIAVSQTDVQEFGCPHCGFRSFAGPVSQGGTTLCTCGECGGEFCILAPGLIRSTIAFNGDIHPELSRQPREGTPSHGTPDERPEGGGEFFRPRGIGSDQTPGCLVCGGPPGLYSNIAAFVRCKASGERVVGMFQHGARLDYRDFEPDRVQVKIGSCEKHLPTLRRLHDLTAQDGIITDERIAQATAP